MTNQELKNQIEAGTISDDPLILKYEDSPFVAKMYAKAIAKIRQLKLIWIDTISEIEEISSGIFDDSSQDLYVCETEKLQEDVKADNKNLIVICKQVPDRLSIDYVEMLKVSPWQIEDFVAMRLPGLDTARIKWLCSVTKYDIYRLDKECEKLEIFPEASQSIMFDRISEENGYCDLNSLTIFNFTNAIMKNDLKTIHDVLANLEYIDIEGSGLITIFSKQFRNLIDIQLNPYATAETLAMNPKQFAAIKYLVGKFSNESLIKIYEFITELDQRLKRGDFQFANDLTENNHKFIEYITFNILTLRG